MKKIYIWGYGNLAKKYIPQIPNNVEIMGIIDSDNTKWGVSDITHNGNNLSCIEDSLEEGDYVVIAIENPHVVKKIASLLRERNIEWCHIFKIVDEEFLKSEKCTNEIKKPGAMMKFIDVMVPVANCNMKCDYCYLSHKKVELDNVSDFYHDAKYIRYALSQDRLGGSAFINLCGIGETLLCKNLENIVDELLREGHYVQIVTNATPTGIIEKFVHSNIDSSRIFFKCSLHYEELKRLNLLRCFANNINNLDKWGASYSIEYVPMDDSVQLIPEIKKFCLENFGALPHVTVARDEKYKDFRILTRYSESEYREIWGQFNSEMFDFKIENVGKRYSQSCKAGLWAAELNIATGDLYKCTNNPKMCNIYQEIDEEIAWNQVGEECCCAYCFNNHAYLTLGLIPDIYTPTYLEMRDRIKIDGTHWIKETLRKVFSQKLYDNNDV